MISISEFLFGMSVQALAILGLIFTCAHLITRVRRLEQRLAAVHELVIEPGPERGKWEPVD